MRFLWRDYTREEMEWEGIWKEDDYIVPRVTLTFPFQSLIILKKLIIREGKFPENFTSFENEFRIMKFIRD